MFGAVKWLFFDVGSTLVDESNAIKHRITDAIEGSDISYEDAYIRVAELAKQNVTNPIKSLGLSVTTCHTEDEIPYPHVANCLAELQKRFSIGIIANQSLGTAFRMEQYGLAEYFDMIIASAEEGVAKPDLKIFEIALERARCLPEHAVMIGDRLDNDIAPAKQVGMKTI